MRTGSPNSASSNTGEGCPLNCAKAAPRDIVREALAGRLHLQLLSRRNLGLLVAKLVEHVHTLEAQALILRNHNAQLNAMIDGKPMEAKRKGKAKS